MSDAIESVDFYCECGLPVRPSDVAGHHDTVEGQYTHILPVDMDTYHADVVGELLAELAKATNHD